MADLRTTTADLTLPPRWCGRPSGIARSPGSCPTVWTVTVVLAGREAWLVLHQAADGRTRYMLSHAPATTSVTQVVAWGCQRSFVERTIEACKSELGLDALQACNYHAEMHHMALTAVSR